MFYESQNILLYKANRVLEFGSRIGIVVQYIIVLHKTAKSKAFHCKFSTNILFDIITGIIDFEYSICIERTAWFSLYLSHAKTASYGYIQYHS